MRVALDATRPLAAIVVGRAGMDLYPIPDGARISDAATFAAEIGGSAGNIAVALARHGLNAALVSPLSADAVGEFVRGSLDRLGVDTSHCRSVAGDYRTSLALAETRKEDCEVVIYRNQAADLQLEPADLDPSWIASAATLIVTGTALARNPSRTAVLDALAQARSAGIFTILDIDHRAYSWSSTDEAATVYLRAARLCHAVVGNDEEFAVLAGSPTSALDAAHTLAKRDCQFVIFKKGGQGSLTITRDESFETEIFPVEAVKPFGAGDAFMGSLVAALLKCGDLRKAVRAASAAAAMVVSKRGCAFAMPDANELAQFISTHAQKGTGHAHSAL